MSEVIKSQRPTAERYPHTAGYVLVLCPDHPRADSKGRVLEHILVKEREIGRPITRAEEVHHLDGDKANNDPKNLILLSQSDHARLHAWMQRVGHQPMQKRKASADAT